MLRKLLYGIFAISLFGYSTIHFFDRMMDFNVQSQNWLSQKQGIKQKFPGLGQTPSYGRKHGLLAFQSTSSVLFINTIDQNHVD
jgi:hypothetical protein